MVLCFIEITRCRNIYRTLRIAYENTPVLKFTIITCSNYLVYLGGINDHKVLTCPAAGAQCHFDTHCSMKYPRLGRDFFQRKMVFRLLLVSIASLISFLLFFGPSKATPIEQSLVRGPRADGKCIILDWTAGHGLDPWLSGDSSSCHITSNRSYLPDISDFDAIVFYHWYVTDFPPIETRRPEQLYIMNYLESPQRSQKLNFHSKSHYFNLTMSYR